MQAAASPDRQEAGSNLASAIAGAYWFFAGIKSALIFLLFQSDPPFGTFVVGLISLGIGLFITSYLATIKNQLDANPLSIPLTAKLLFAFTAWSAVSAAWSQADSQSTAIAYWGVATLDIAIAFILVRIGPIDRVVKASLWGMVLGSVCIGLIVLLVSGGTGDNRLGDDQFLSPNVVGNQIAMASLVGLYLVTRSQAATVERSFSMLATLFLGFTLLQTLSKTSILSFTAAVLCLVLLGRITFWKKLLVSVGGLGVTLASFTTLESYWSFYTGEVQGGTALDTFSGRTVLWAKTWDMILDNPILGYGLLAFRDMGPQIASVRLVQAHNEVLHTWFSYGAVGLALVVALYLAHASQILRLRKLTNVAERVTLAASLLAYCIVRGITEASLVGLVYPLPLLLLITLWLRHGEQPDANVEAS